MGVAMIKCPNTAREISTGIVTDRASFEIRFAELSMSGSPRTAGYATRLRLLREASRPATWTPPTEWTMPTEDNRREQSTKLRMHRLAGLALDASQREARRRPTQVFFSAG